MKLPINTALLTEQLKRYWVFAAMFMLGYVLFILAPIIYNKQKASYLKAADSLLSMTDIPMSLATVTVPLCAVFIIFTHWFKPQAATAFNGFPFSREQLLFTNIAAGAVLMLTPVFILSLLVLLVYPYNSPSFYNVVIYTLPQVVGFFMRTSVSMLFYFSLYLLAASLSGNRVIAILLCVLFPFLPFIGLLLKEVISLSFVFGYYDLYAYDTFDWLFYFIHPIFGWEDAINWDAVNGTGIECLVPLYLRYIAFTATFGGAAYFIDRIRKHERIGDSVVFTPVKNILIFLVAAAVMIIMGLWLGYMFGSIELLYLGYAIGFTIAFFIAQMIAENSFNIWYKVKKLPFFYTIAAGIYISIRLITRLDALGYEKYIPQQEMVVGFVLERSWNVHNYPDDDLRFTTDTDAITLALSAHKKTVDNRRHLRTDYAEIYERNRFNYGFQRESYTQYIHYRLKNGKTIARQYELTDSFMEEAGWRKLQNTDPVIISQRLPAIKDPQHISEVVLKYKRAEVESVNINILSVDFATLCEILKEEVIANYNGKSLIIQNYSYSGISNINISFFLNRDYDQNNRTFSICPDSYPKTVDWLYNQGYLRSIASVYTD